jgi:hypothetical protein
MVIIVIEIKIFRLKFTLKLLKSILPDFKDLNILILFFSAIYGKDSSGSIQYRNLLVS